MRYTKDLVSFIADVGNTSSDDVIHYGSSFFECGPSGTRLHRRILVDILSLFFNFYSHAISFEVPLSIFQLLEQSQRTELRTSGTFK